MGKRIDQFCENLRQRLTMIDCGLDGLRAKIDSDVLTADRHVQSHLERVRKRIEQGRSRVTAAKTDVATWVQDRNAVSIDTIAAWKTLPKPLASVTPPTFGTLFGVGPTLRLTNLEALRGTSPRLTELSRSPAAEAAGDRTTLAATHPNSGRR